MPPHCHESLMRTVEGGIVFRVVAPEIGGADKQLTFGIQLQCLSSSQSPSRKAA